MCYKGYNLFTHQLLTSSTNHKGYLTFYSPPYGGGVGGGAAISLAFHSPPYGGGVGGGAAYFLYPISSYAVLRPPSLLFFNIFFLTRSFKSRVAVSCEQ